ncbi:MAG: S8 family serine peptidase [Oligoflexia bacterium]|nr:S8 family serine peptidase [Oligoflexia bacterium]
MRNKIFCTLFLLIAFQSTWAQTQTMMGIIDSGVDVTNKMLAPHVRVDAPGWNFIDGNDQLFDYASLKRFNENHYTFINLGAEVQGGKTLTEAEMAWIKEKRSSEQFMKEVEELATMIHGTHVAGIAIGKISANTIMALKVVPTKVSINKDIPTPSNINSNFLYVWLTKLALKLAVYANSKNEQAFIRYIHNQKITVANASFGIGYQNAQEVIKTIFKKAFRRNPSERELTTCTDYLLDKVLKAQKKTYGKSTDTLFIFAAGNDGSNNDLLPAAPANLGLENTLSVAATFGRSSLAKFSNYGKLVDVGAPGVNIPSTGPGDRTVRMSGTSMAAPYVSGVAGETLAMNPSLTARQLKSIILKTVDVKDFLKDKVASSGIVNRARAVFAAKLSNDLPLEDAIIRANQEIADESIDKDKALLKSKYPMFEYVVPLQSMFQY